MITPEQKKHLAAQKAFLSLTGLKVGSKVVVTHKAASHKFGWNNEWTQSMNTFVGKEYKVSKIDTDKARGIELKSNSSFYSFPFFALEIIDTSVIKLTDDYEATINANGSVSVGCQHIPFEVLERVYESAKVAYNNCEDI